MNFSDFYHTCLQHYRIEFEDAEALYQRLSPMLATQAVLWGVLVSVSNMDYFRRSLQEFYLLPYSFSVVIAALALATSLLLLFQAALPRSYSTLATLGKWTKWKEDFARSRAASALAENDDSVALDIEFENKMISAMLEAQETNSRINEMRRKTFKRAVFLLAVATVAVFFAGLLQFGFALWRV